MAFPTGAVRLALQAGQVIETAGVFLEASGGGFRAVDFEGNELVAHESFWFAWSQFMPDTEVWCRPHPEPATRRRRRSETSWSDPSYG